MSAGRPLIWLSSISPCVPPSTRSTAPPHSPRRDSSSRSTIPTPSSERSWFPMARIKTGATDPSTMIDGSVEPVLILAIGNQLLSDDGVGMVLLEELSRRGEWGGAVDLVDGGTQGLMLLSQISRSE